MMRFYSAHNDACNGTHLHMAHIAYGRNQADCLASLRRARPVGMRAHLRPIIFFDQGPGDMVKKRMESITDEVI